MAEVQTQLMTFFDSFPGTILLTDPQGTVVYVNQTIEHRHGFQRAQVVGQKAGALWGRQMPPSFYQELWSVIAVKKQPYISSITNKKKAGALQEEDIHIAPIFGPSQDIVYFMELHPGLDGAQLTRFEDEFSNLWRSSYAQQTNIVLPWISHWVGHTPLPNNTGLTVSAHEDAAQTFLNFLVSPTQQLLGERHSDKTLVEAAQRDPGEFRVLYEKYQKKIFDYFFHRINNDADSARDLTQETFTRAFRALPNFRATNAHYGTYLMRIAHNLLMNQYRTYRPILYDTSILAQLGYEPAYEQKEADTLPKEVWQAVEGLTNTEKQVMKMKYEDDMRVSEIAAVLNKSENAIKLCLTRARHKIRQRLCVITDKPYVGL